MLWKCPLISFQESFWFSSLFNLIFPHNKTFYFQFQVFFFFLLHSFFFWLVVLLQAPVLSLSKLFLSPLSPSIPRFGNAAGTRILRREFSSGAEKHPLLTLQPNRVFLFSLPESLHELKSLLLWLGIANGASGVSGSVKRNRSESIFFWHFEWE